MEKFVENGVVKLKKAEINRCNAVLGTPVILSAMQTLLSRNTVDHRNELLSVRSFERNSKRWIEPDIFLK